MRRKIRVSWRDCKGKITGGIGWNLRISGVEQEQIWVSQVPLGYRRFQICCVFVEYNLFNTIYESYTKSYIYIYTFWYNFDTVLYQFLETGALDRSLTCFIQNLRFLGFSLYPLSFFLYSPFKEYTIYIQSTRKDLKSVFWDSPSFL